MSYSVLSHLWDHFQHHGDIAAECCAERVSEGDRYNIAALHAENAVIWYGRRDACVRAAMHPASVVTLDLCQCACGRARQWSDLPLVGVQRFDDPGEPDLELRNCPCGSTHARQL